MLNKLFIKNNVESNILKLYQGNEYYAKLSNHYPVVREYVNEEIHVVPPCIEKEQKYFLSIYNEEDKLTAVLDILDKYSFQNENNEKTVWIGLLQIDADLHGKGLGKQVVTALEMACKKSGKKLLQLGVIKDNIIGLNFWRKQGFKVFFEKNNGEYDLYLMKKDI